MPRRSLAIDSHAASSASAGAGAGRAKHRTWIAHVYTQARGLRSATASPVPTAPRAPRWRARAPRGSGEPPRGRPRGPSRQPTLLAPDRDGAYAAAPDGRSRQPGTCARAAAEHSFVAKLQRAPGRPRTRAGRSSYRGVLLTSHHPASLSGHRAGTREKRGAPDHTVVFLDDRHIVHPSSVSDARTILCRRIGRSAGGRTRTCCKRGG